MSGEVNMIPTLRKFRGGPVQANLGGASLETFSGEGQLKKSPCIYTINQVPGSCADGILIEKRLSVAFL